MIESFKRIYFFCRYWIEVKKISTELDAEFNLKLNWIRELYTVININQENYDTYGPVYAKEECAKYIRQCRLWFLKNDLDELVDLIKVKKWDNYNYEVYFGSAKLNNRLFFKGLIRFVTFFVVLSVATLIAYLNF